ncbi:MAG: flagellin [Clostridiaceae bacterium]|nr:flagellin [Clostridiaceae bacterium]
MRINHNISALNTYRQLTLNTTAGSKSLEKLSSGYRINRAGDDAAGLAISEKMRGQIRGLEQATRNAQDGISLIQTAEGALNETHSILQRMRELSVQAANGTNTDDDRKELQKEINQLKSEIDRISTDTEFNTKKLLNGSIANTAVISSTGNSGNILKATIENDNLVAGNYTVDVSSTTVNNNISGTVNNSNLNAFTTTSGVALGDYTVELTANGTDWDIKITDASGTVVASAAAQTIDTSGSDATISVGDFDLTWNNGTTVAAGKTNITISADTTLKVKDSSGNLIESKTVTGNTTGEVSVGGFKLSFDSSITNSSTADDTAITVDTKAVSFQIGANAGQTTKLAIADMSSKALGVDSLDLTTTDGAKDAIDSIDEAIKTVSGERSKLGAVQNRLEHTINNLGTSAENLTAAESRIRDVDMAKEMMEFTKNNILTQAAQAMLAQANQQPQGVLQLLR